MKLRVCLYSDDGRAIPRTGMNISVFTDITDTFLVDAYSSRLSEGEFGVEFTDLRSSEYGISIVVMDEQFEYGGVDFAGIHGERSNVLHLLLDRLPPPGGLGGANMPISPRRGNFNFRDSTNSFPDLTDLLTKSKAYPSWTASQRDAVIRLGLSYIRLCVSGASARPMVETRYQKVGTILANWRVCLESLDIVFRNFATEAAPGAVVAQKHAAMTAKG